MSKTYNLADLLMIVAEAVPEREALVCNNERRTFRQLIERATALARWLRSEGIAAGDTVGIQAYNSIQHFEAYLASFLLKAIPVNINYRYLAEECRYLYDNAELKALIYQNAVEAAVEEALPAAPGVKVLIRIGDENKNLSNSVSFEAAIQASGPPLGEVGRSDDDLVLLYTGGTTGMPKGVMWTHKALFAYFA